MSEEPSLQRLDAAISEAQTALMQKAQEDPEKWWDPRALRLAAQNGWSGDVMSFALTDLVNRGQLFLNVQLHVRAAPED